ncbi:thioredoxin family protein [Staphylococcus americanisciuri]|uniref:Thioredoxin family protein n=1 Tax=Staphylococcus americanisciuri TaxID=2973940 RepID=A0ABT2F4R8_9STAP|nr:thioredoxin family protein [Staphylococcus americanisciuri]MCS4486855.1 thioredoxin family protein [Staphylococcus americanisciuri]
MHRDESQEKLTQYFDRDIHLIFGYTTMCGTCKVSERMLDVANNIVKLPLTKVDLNYYPIFNQEHEIQSVPVLLIMKRNREHDRLYAFQSVPFLLEKIKKAIDEI